MGSLLFVKKYSILFACLFLLENIVPSLLVAMEFVEIKNCIFL